MKISKKNLLTAILSIAVVCGAAAVYIYFGRANASPQPLDYATAKKADLTETVTASGQVKAENDLSLSFEHGGKIANTSVKIGQAVRLGQTLASLDTSDLEIQLRLAQNSLDGARIKLNQLKNANNSTAGGSTEIKTAIDNSLENAANKIKESYIAADGIMGSSIDQFFSQPESDHPIFGLTVSQGNSVYMISAPYEASSELNKKRRDITGSMSKWEKDLGNIDQENIDGAQSDAETSLGKIQSLLTDLAVIVNSYNSTSANDNLVYSSYKSAIQNSRITIDSTLAGILSSKQIYNSSKANANPDNVKIQEIAVSNAENQLDSIQNQIAESTIFSPINGIVSMQNAKTGETASAGIPLIGIFSNSRPQIDVYLAESDIAKIKTGQTATVTMDAIGGKTFGTHVIGTDPGSQKIGSAQSYKTTLQFDQNISDIKLGMTANVNIDVSQRDNVVAIPARSIIKKNDKSFVMVKIDDRRSEEREIITGITGQNGYIEVIDGLKEGEMIINY